MIIQATFAKVALARLAILGLAHDFAAVVTGRARIAQAILAIVIVAFRAPLDVLHIDLVTANIALESGVL
jgi:hypothetical protein